MRLFKNLVFAGNVQQYVPLFLFSQSDTMSKLPSPVQALIEQEKLQKILWVSGQHGEPAQGLTCASTGQVLDAQFQGRFDLVFIDADELTGNKSRTLTLIAKARDVLASRVWVACRSEAAHDWQETDFLALALAKRAVTEDETGQTLYYGYDIKTYKATPDWLNPKFWANPHMWDKARW